MYSKTYSSWYKTFFYVKTKIVLVEIMITQIDSVNLITNPNKKHKIQPHRLSQQN